MTPISISKLYVPTCLAAAALVAPLGLMGCDGCGGPPPFEPPPARPAPTTPEAGTSPAAAQTASAAPQTAPAAPATHAAATPEPKKTEAPAASLFPADRALGTLKYYDEATYKWVDIGEARGNVALPEGKKLTLAVTKEGAADLSPLAKLPPNTLAAISFDGVAVPDEQIAHLTALKGLTKISFRGAKVSDAALARLAELPKLQELDFALSEIGDAAIAQLVGLPALETLDISYTKVTDAGVEDLAKIKTLNYLDPQRSAITEKGEARLAELRPELTIVKR